MTFDSSFPIPIEHNRSLKDLSTFRIGGEARWFCVVKQFDELQTVIRSCYQYRIPYIIIGKGSNCLFDDRGFDGLVVLNKIGFCRFDKNLVSVGAGYSFSLLGVQTARKGWAGLEFASGIPGTVGGAIYMNAGANGAETQDVLQSVTYVNERGEIEEFSREKLQFGYRTSSFQQKRGAIAAAQFQLNPSSKAREDQLSIVAYRQKTQPYGLPSAGCVFRNPPAQSAGALIQQAGLKGLRMGDAEVSLLHANFIVNQGLATSNDVIALAHEVQRQVKEKMGTDLEMEVRKIPYQMESFWDV